MRRKRIGQTLLGSPPLFMSDAVWHEPAVTCLPGTGVSHEFGLTTWPPVQAHSQGHAPGKEALSPAIREIRQR